MVQIHTDWLTRGQEWVAVLCFCSSDESRRKAITEKEEKYGIAADFRRKWKVQNCAPGKWEVI